MAEILIRNDKLKSIDVTLAGNTAVFRRLSEICIETKTRFNEGYITVDEKYKQTVENLIASIVIHSIK